MCTCTSKVYRVLTSLATGKFPIFAFLLYFQYATILHVSFYNSNVAENVRVGWRERIFRGIKERLGFGFEELDV